MLKGTKEPKRSPVSSPKTRDSGQHGPRACRSRKEGSVAASVMTNRMLIEDQGPPKDPSRIEPVCTVLEMRRGKPVDAVGPPNTGIKPGIFTTTGTRMRGPNDM